MEAATRPFRVLPLPNKCRLRGSSRRTAADACAWAPKRIGLIEAGRKETDTLSEDVP